MNNIKSTKKKRERKKICQNVKHDCFEGLEYGLLFCFWLSVVNCEARDFVLVVFFVFFFFFKSAPPTAYDTGRIPGTNHA